MASTPRTIKATPVAVTIDDDSSSDDDAHSHLLRRAQPHQQHSSHRAGAARKCSASSKDKGEDKSIEQTRRLGQLLGVCIPLLMSVYTYMAFALIIPNLRLSSSASVCTLMRTILCALCVVLVTLMFWSFFKAKYSHPGPIPLSWRAWKGDALLRPALPSYAQLTEWTQGSKSQMFIFYNFVIFVILLFCYFCYFSFFRYTCDGS